MSNIVQPTEMSLEEIESRIGSLIQSDTIALLKSAVWKERLEGWQSPTCSDFVYFLLFILGGNMLVNRVGVGCLVDGLTSESL